MDLKSAYLSGYEKWIEKTARRFWAKVDKRGPDDCWLWTAMTNQKGYGEISLGYPVSYRNTRKVPATWLSLWLAGVDIPPDHCAMHKCDNPPCVNPAHLRLGTNEENIKDKVSKRRQAPGLKGESNPTSKLTEEQVREIRRLYATGNYPHKKLAKMFGVTYGLIGFITRRVIWKHIAD